MLTNTVVAIIMTIMVLEIKVPEIDSLKGILKEIPYFISFVISFLYICTAWYNHHYILAKSKWFSKRAFWANNFWLLCMALIPVATAWVSKFPESVTPEYFYFSCYVLWAVAYYLLNVTVTSDNNKQAKPNKSTTNTRFINKHAYIDISLLVIGLIGIKYYPLLGLILPACQIVTWIIFTPKDSDKFTLLN
ncbi:hypothetical protein QZ81_02250 [Enterococcus faecalis]|nr:hypothetical protein QZ81_02250 [Enterococcus faecalis]